MNQNEIKSVVLTELYAIAPELEDEEVSADINFRDQFDFDSMDFLNFVTGLHQSLGIDIPEVDYSQLLNLNACINYIESKLPKPA